MSFHIFLISFGHIIADFIENTQNTINNAVLIDDKVIAKIIGKEIYFDFPSVCLSALGFTR